MYVSSIFLDRFGRRSNVRIENLSEGLNVLYGQPGSGKTTLVDFLRAMWNGFDSTLRKRYIPPDSRGFGGVVTFQTKYGRQTISRYDDGGRDGRLTVEKGDGSVIGRRHVQDLIGEATLALVERAFTVDFQRGPLLSELLQVATDLGLQTSARHPSSGRLPLLEQTIAEKRDQLTRLAPPTESTKVLRQRRRELLQRLESHHAVQRVQAEEKQGQRRQLEKDIAVFQQQEFELQNELLALERELGERSHDVTGSSTSEAVDLSHDSTARLRSLDRQLSRWKRTLREVVVRKRRASEPLDHGRMGTVAAAAKDAKPRHHLAALEDKILEFGRTLEDMAQKNECVCHELRSVLSRTIESMLEDIYQVCNDLNHWESNHQIRKAATEREQLARCESELRHSIRLLVAKRQNLLHESSTANSSPQVDGQSHPFCRCSTHQQPAAGEPTQLLHGDENPPTVSATPSTPATDSYTSRIADLRRAKQRELELVVARLAEARTKLIQDRGVAPDADSERDALRGALDRVEESLRASDQRHAINAEIANLEAECRMLREQEVVPSLVQEASRYLCRLTSGEWTAIHLGAANTVQIEGIQGRRVHYQDLGAGNRDQVYLAICLAVVAASGRKGVRLPLVLNAAFAHYPTKHVHDAIELLREFGRERQVLCLTRHEHVVREAQLLNVPVQVLSDSDSVTREFEPADRWDSKAGPHTSPSDFYLHERDPIESAPSIDEINCGRLKGVGIWRVGDLLRVPAAEMVGPLQRTGITVKMVQAWQSQARLMCRVRGLRQYDARVLVGCGISDPAELLRTSPAELRRRIKEFAASPEGQAILMSGTEAELSRVTDWIQIGPDQSSWLKYVARLARNSRTSNAA